MSRFIAGSAHSHQFRHRSHVQLAHQPRAVQLNGALADPQLDGHHLVGLAGADTIEHLALARRELFETRARRRAPALLVQPPPVLGDGLLHAPDEPVVIRERLLEEVHRALLEGRDRRGHVGMTGEEDDGRRALVPGEVRLQFETAGARHAHVQQQAARTGRVIAPEKGIPVLAGHHLEAGAREQHAERIAHGRVVVHHVHERDRAVHAGLPQSGSVKLNTAPRPSLGAAHMVPPCERTMEREMDRPWPMPSRFVVKNASNTRRASPSGRPQPLSATRMRKYPDGSSRRPVIVSRRSPLFSSMAWMAFWMRFTSTCSTWMTLTATHASASRAMLSVTPCWR